MHAPDPHFVNQHAGLYVAAQVQVVAHHMLAQLHVGGMAGQAGRALHIGGSAAYAALGLELAIEIKRQLLVAGMIGSADKEPVALQQRQVGSLVLEAKLYGQRRGNYAQARCSGHHKGGERLYGQLPADALHDLVAYGVVARSRRVQGLIALYAAILGKGAAQQEDTFADQALVIEQVSHAHARLDGPAAEGQAIRIIGFRNSEHAALYAVGGETAVLGHDLQGAVALVVKAGLIAGIAGFRATVMPAAARRVFLVVVELVIIGILIEDIGEGKREFILVIQAVAVSVHAGGVVDQRVGAVVILSDVIPGVTVRILVPVARIQRIEGLDRV